MLFKSQNRFEGRSNYQHYRPTQDMDEQKLERYWFKGVNQALQEKRTAEEIRLSLREWSEARARLESEIQRRKEHRVAASQFEARAFVRSSFKSKHFRPGDNPLECESSESEEELVVMSESQMQSTMPQTEKKERLVVSEYRDEEIKEEEEEEEEVEFNQR